MTTVDEDAAIRAAAISYVLERADHAGGFVTRSDLEGFSVGAERIPLIDQGRGIRNPRQLLATLTILSSPTGPYADKALGGGLLRYDYRRGDADRGDNRKLRLSAELGVPMILLQKISDGVFVPHAPIYAIDDNQAGRFVVVALDDEARRVALSSDASDHERRYAERRVRARLHQREFRARVLRAYGVCCAMCGLDIGDLLEAAHIVGDVDELGQPLTSNGIALCKLHHGAFDKHLIGVRPDHLLQIRPDLLRRTGSPMPVQGLQALHNARMTLPTRRTDQPDPRRLGLRFAAFEKACREHPARG